MPGYTGLYSNRRNLRAKSKTIFQPRCRQGLLFGGNRNENVTLKLNFALSWVFCDYSMLVTLYKIGGVHFCLLGTNGFHVKTKNERFTAASSRCHQNLKYENFTSSFGRLRQNIAPNIVPHDYFSSFNQSNSWFVAVLLTLPSSNLKFLIAEDESFGQRFCCVRIQILLVSPEIA